MPADFDLHQWCADEELETCPACTGTQRKGLTITASESFICFACGLIQTRHGTTGVTELQDRERPG